MTYTDQNTYLIPDFKLPEFQAAITKMNRKAAKLGVEPIAVEVIANVTKKIYREPEEGQLPTKNKFYEIPATAIALFGKAPQVEGFEFIARIESLGDGELKLFHTVPGTETKIDERFRTLNSSVCEHCNTARMRKDVFVVKELATGQQKQVGRQCLADYTGIHTVENLAARASWASEVSALIGEIDEYWSGGCGSYFAGKVDTLHALALTSAYIEAFGWVPKSACFDGSKTPTSGYVADHYASRAKMKPDEKEFLEKFDAKALEPKHIQRAAETVEWVKAFTPRADSDYEMNLKTLVVKELATTNHLGIVCSAVAAWQRATNQAVEYAKKKETFKNSKAIGTEGDKLTNLPVTIDSVRSFSGDYGPTTLIKFVTDDGNLLSWFATGDKEFEVGAKFTITTARVKGHKVFNGITETQIKNAKVA